jgi:hypothetical protein
MATQVIHLFDNPKHEYDVVIAHCALVGGEDRIIKIRCDDEPQVQTLRAREPMPTGGRTQLSMAGSARPSKSTRSVKRGIAASTE